MLDHNRLEEFIEQIRLTPAIWKNREFDISREHMNEIWAHFGHTFDISREFCTYMKIISNRFLAKEAEMQWEYLIRLHRFMNRNASLEVSRTI